MKILIGGSPCTHWSIAKSKNRETEPSGIGWELFRNYLIALEKYKPDYFLYENNKSMAPQIKDQITKELGVEPVMIDSAKLSAQTRKRLYWVGKLTENGEYSTVPINQPQELGQILSDILDTVIFPKEKLYHLKPLSDKEIGYMYNGTQGGYCGRLSYIQKPVGHNKALCVTANFSRGVPYNVMFEPIRIATIENNANREDFDSQQYRVYSPVGKSVTLCGQGGGVGAKTGLYAIPVVAELCGNVFPIYEVKDGMVNIKENNYPIKLPDGHYVVRKLSVPECKRLQTIPDEYEFPVSNTQAYKMIGNGWTVDVIAHIMSHFVGIDWDEVEVLSMYDGMSCGHIALDKLGANISTYYATEIDPYAIKTTLHNYPDTIQLGDAFQVREAGWCLTSGG